MKAAAVVLTYGCARLSELLAQLEHQTRPLPVLLLVDDTPELEIEPYPWLQVVYSDRDTGASLGPLRRDAVEIARGLFSLSATDAVVVLDDDDFYHSRHFELTLQALGSADWTGGLSIGFRPHEGEPIELVRGEGGVGQHATWAFRLRLYDAAGGYQDEPQEDVALGMRMGWVHCAPHWYTTHVRLHNRPPSSYVRGARYVDRAALRARGSVNMHAHALWTPDCELLERWCGWYLRDVPY